MGAIAQIICSFKPVAAGPPYTMTDSDAAAFTTAAGITNNTQMQAVDNLVIALKAASLWTKMYAVYPFVGGTATTHKWNLKNPLDTDGAYRIVWTGTPTHNSAGVQGTGATTTFGDTKIPHNLTNMTINFHISAYTPSTGTTDGGIMGGSFSPARGVTVQTRLAIASTSLYSIVNQLAPSATPATIPGFYNASRTANNLMHLYKNGATIANDTGTNSTFTNSATLFVLRESGTASNKIMSFASFGQGLDATEAANLYTAVQAYQTTLGRQV